MCIEGNRKKTLWQKKEIGKRHSQRERERERERDLSHVHSQLR